MTRFWLFWFWLAVIAVPTATLAQAETGRVTGGQKFTLPEWFKPSFLDIPEDVREARKHGRQLLIFMELEECPYCARTLNENFRQGENMAYIRQHFDVIGMNVRGSREVVWIDGNVYSEQSLAIHLRAWGTPVVLFISPEGQLVVQLSGYRTPNAFRHVLEYVSERAYRERSLAEHVERRQKAVYRLRDHSRFERIDDLSKIDQPLVVIFEDTTCTDCDGFHDKVFSHPDVQKELEPYRVVRLNTATETPLRDPAGANTTPRAWATSLRLNHRPAVLLIDRGREVGRVEGRFYHFHFKELLRFVSGRHYLEYESFGAYLRARQETLLRQGVDIDLGE